MNAYLIDPFEFAVEPVDYDGDYRSIYPLIDARTFDVASFDKEFDDAVYVDDEGLFVPDQRFFMIGDYPEPLAGKGLVLGLDIETGETVAPRFTLEQVRQRVRFGDFVKIQNTVLFFTFPEQPHRKGSTRA